MEFTLNDLKQVLQDSAGIDVDRMCRDPGELMDVSLRDLGCDSLVMLDIAGAIEKARAIAVPDEVVQTLSTPRILLAFVNDQARMAG
jgi:acyl carrier protein